MGRSLDTSVLDVYKHVLVPVLQFISGVFQREQNGAGRTSVAQFGLCVIVFRINRSRCYGSDQQEALWGHVQDTAEGKYFMFASKFLYYCHLSSSVPHFNSSSGGNGSN